MPFRVDIIESERGWGSKIDERIYFNYSEDASNYQNKFNSSNPPGPAPDWYMQAEDPVYVREVPEGVEVR